MVLLTMARRGVLNLLIATLLATVAVVGTAHPASARAACTGFVTNSIESAQDTLLGYIRSDGTRGVVDRSLSAVGSVAIPINRFIIRSGTVAVYIDYSDLGNGRHLATHGPVYPGTYQVNPCHKAVVRLVWQ